MKLQSLKSRSGLYFFLGLGVLSFAFSPILVRFASEGPGLAIAVWRTGLAALLLAPFAFYKSGEELASFSGRDWLLIVSAGVFLGFHFITWIESLYHTTVASTSVLVTTSPIFLAIFGFFLLNERLQRPVVISLITAVLGAALIAWSDSAATNTAPNPLWGNSLALMAALLVSGYLLIGRVVRQTTSWLAYVFPLYAIAAITAVAVAMAQGIELFDYSWEFFGLCLLMAIGPQIIGHGSFNYAIYYFPAALVGMLALLEPVGAGILAYILFGEAPALLSIGGMIVVLSAVSVIILHRRRQSRQHPEKSS